MWKGVPQYSSKTQDSVVPDTTEQKLYNCINFIGTQFPKSASTQNRPWSRSHSLESMFTLLVSVTACSTGFLEIMLQNCLPGQGNLSSIELWQSKPFFYYPSLMNMGTSLQHGAMILLHKLLQGLLIVFQTHRKKYLPSKWRISWPWPRLRISSCGAWLRQ